jgi:hypothetical protein
LGRAPDGRPVDTPEANCYNPYKHEKREFMIKRDDEALKEG